MAATLTAQAQAQAHHHSSLRILHWGEPAVIQGQVKTGVFENCCNFGKSHMSAYVYLKLAQPVDVRTVASQVQTDSDFLNIRFIQLEADAKNWKRLNSKLTVNVSCSEIRFGSNGHYALPVYCASPSIETTKAKGLT